MSPLPPDTPDRGHISTEHRHPLTHELDRLSLTERLELMTDDHEQAVRAVRGAGPALVRFIEELTPRVRAGGRLVYLGAGTSGRLGVLDAAECPPTFRADPGQIIGVVAGGDRSLRHSSEGREDEPDGATGALEEITLGKRDTLLGIAAGGTTPYVLGAIEYARSRGAMTGLLTCAAATSPPAGCQHLIVLETGAEVLTGSTRLKAGSATKIALNFITTNLYIELGKVYGNLMVDLRATNSKLRDRAIRILRELSPGLGREQAAAALDRAGGELKLAVVMERTGCDPAQARARLQAADGHLREVIGTEEARRDEGTEARRGGSRHRGVE